MSKKNAKKKGSAKRTLLTILCIVLALILVLLIVATAYIEGILGLIGRDVDNSTMSSSEYEEWLNSQTEEVDPTFTGVTIDPSDVTWNTQDTIDQGEHVINILLIGQDRRSGQGRQRSDAMILCTVNTDTKTLTMTSFMRDMYVQIPGYSDDRINACYQLGGMETLDACLEVNFGVQVDGNVEVDFYGFMDLIDMLGGVDIELTQSEANYLNKRGNWDVDNSTAWQWNLTAGVNHLTGEQALAYARTRYVGNGDFERTERQRKVISAVVEQCRGLSISELNNLLKAALPLLTTDLSNSEIISYASQVFTILPELQIVTQRIPADGTYKSASIRGMSVLVPDLEANRKLLEDSMQLSENAD